MLSGTMVNSEGIIVGYYSNGEIRNIAQLALADFDNVYGLIRCGSMFYQWLPSAGDPLYNMPGVNSMGSISAGMLEESNVDLAAEFIKMIFIRRG
jgi:flagellar hook protein FlgE